MCSNYKRDASVTSMLAQLKWPSLQQLRFVTQCTFLYKAVHHQTAISIPSYVQIPQRQSKGHHEYSFVNIKTHTDSYRCSFFPRTIRSWNLLPQNIINTANVNQFKSSLWDAITHKNIIVVNPRDVFHLPRQGTWTPESPAYVI